MKSELFGADQSLAEYLAHSRHPTSVEWVKPVASYFDLSSSGRQYFRGSVMKLLF